MFGQTKVCIDKGLYLRADELARQKGYSDVHEFVAHVLERELAGQAAADAELATRRLRIGVLQMSTVLTSPAECGYLGSRLIELTCLAVACTAALIASERMLGLWRPMRRLRRLMVADLYEIRLYWRRPARVLRAELKLALRLAAYVGLCGPMIAGGSLAYLAGRDWVDNRYGYAAAEVGRDVSVRLTAEWPDAIGDAPMVSNEDAVVTARVCVPALCSQWVRVRPLRAGVLNVVLADGINRFPLRVGDASGPSSPGQTAGRTRVLINYRPSELWGLRGGHWWHLLGVCLLSHWPLTRWLGGRGRR